MACLLNLIARQTLWFARRTHDEHSQTEETLWKWLQDMPVLMPMMSRTWSADVPYGLLGIPSSPQNTQAYAASNALACMPGEFCRNPAVERNGSALLHWRYANTSSDDCCIITFRALASGGLINESLVIPQLLLLLRLRRVESFLDEEIPS